MKKKFLISASFMVLFFFGVTFAQEAEKKEDPRNLPSMHADTEWYKLMQVAEPNLFEVQKAYDRYFMVHEFEKSKETRDFRRWKKHTVGDNYDINGNVGRQTVIPEDLTILASQNSGIRKVAGAAGTANWTRIPIIPDMVPSWQSGSYTQGTCNMMAIHPTDSNQMIAAFIDGGTLWRTTDYCKTWTQCATNLLVRHFGSVVYCKNNPNIVYAGSSQALIKSTNAGETWSVCTGWDKRAGYPGGDEIWAMEVKADNPDYVLFATGSTIYRSINGGASVTSTAMAGKVRDIRALPGNPNIVFATVKTSTFVALMRSTDFGASWTSVTNGYPASIDGYTGELGMIAISPSEPNSVWVELIAQNTAAAKTTTYGIYKSTDGGVSFTKTAVTQDLTDSFWQGGWNQAFAISDTDPNIMAGGAYCTYVTKDGGISWNKDGSMGKTGPHSDVHGIVIRGTSVWVVGDGGITVTYNYGKPSSYIHSVDDGIQSHCLWGFDQAWKSDVMIVGMYHGPTTIRDDNTYVGWYPGPGADAGVSFVNKGDDRFLYANPWGLSRITRSTVRTTPPTSKTISYIMKGNNEMNDPNYYEKIYGFNTSKVMTSYNNAINFTDSTSFQSNVNDYVVALTDNKRVYARAGNTIMKSTDGGVTWINITPSTSVTLSQNISHMAIDGKNPDNIWATFGGKQSTRKVIKSTDGGTTWKDYSLTGLPSYSINCIISQMGTDGLVYIGTDVGVYYADNSSTSWKTYTDGLPAATHVAWIKINYAKAKLRIAGQTGIWESDLYTQSAPIAHPTTGFFESNTGTPFQFADMSVALANATYEWTFESGSPATSDKERPIVTFTDGGDKDVTLKVTDSNGTDTRTYKGFVRIHSAGDVDKTGWKIIYCSSEHTDYPANNIIDGKLDKFWRTAAFGAKYPYEVQVDMGKETSIQSFKLNPMQYFGQVGSTPLIKGYEWYVSNDGVDWGVAIASGEFAYSLAEQIVQLTKPVSAKYFKLRAINSWGGTIAAAAEIGINGTTGVISSFSANKTIVHPGKTVTFKDESAGNPTAWSWSFPGGTPSTSTDQNPVVTYPTEGVYPVTLSVSNANGKDVITKSSFITVTDFVPRNGWTVVYVDSEESKSEKTPAYLAFDGSNTTFWGTQWSPTVTPMPHELVIDMGSVKDIAGFNYVPRQNNANGRIKDYEFYISLDGTNWTLASTGTWANTATEQVITFAQTTARYFKLVAKSEVNGNGFTTVAEIKIRIPEDNGSQNSINSAKDNEKASIYSYSNSIYVGNDKYNKAIVEVIDYMGRQILKENIGKGLNEFRMGRTGAYVVKVTIDNTIVTRKVIIE